MTRKSGHIWQIWAEMTQTPKPKSTKVAQIHLPECNSAKIRHKFCQILPNFLPNFPPKFAKFPPKFAKISQISFHKRALTLNSQGSAVLEKKASDLGQELGSGKKLLFVNKATRSFCPAVLPIEHDMSIWAYHLPLASPVSSYGVPCAFGS